MLPPDAAEMKGFYLITAGDLRLVSGTLAPARTDFQAAHAVFDSHSKTDPGNTEWQRDLSVANRGSATCWWRRATARGRSNRYRDGLAIRETLASRDPGNAEWQRDLSVCYDKIGDVLVAQGDLDGALTSYRDGLAIAETLAQADPGNAEWQRDLSVSHDKIGDVLVAQGDLRRARSQSYRDGLAIRETPGARPTPATPNGSAICRSSTTRSATCWWRRATCAARSTPTAPASRSPSAGAARPRQCRVAARSVGQPQQDRRRAGGAGRPRGALKSYRAGLAIARRWPPRPRQRRMAARSVGLATRRSATCWWRRATCAGGAHSLPRRPRDRRDAGRAPTPATPSGSAISRSRTTRSATC